MPTKAQIKRSRLLAEALGNEATSTAPVGHWTQGLARVLQGGISGYHSGQADKMEGERSQQLAQALSGNMTPDEMRNYGAVNGFEDELFPMADRRQDQQNWQSEFGFKKDRAAVDDNQWAQGFGLQKDQFGLQQDQFDFTKSQPFEVGGNLVDRETYKPLYEAPQSPSTVINNSAGSNEGALKKKLAEKEGESWAGMQEAASVSGGMLQDLDALDELLKMAPQGPIQGRLAQAFPGFSSSADAANSIVKRIAPTLRTPGSGSTSDIEYDGMLKSVPNLVNTPGGNNIISATMRAKAQINVEKGQIIAGYQNGQITEEDARTRLQELNKRSIMTPEMKQMIFGNAQPSSGGGSEIDPLLDKYAPK
jgi:hypothetical protein